MDLTWPTDFTNKIICGDCLEVMKEMPDESVDLIIIDPPYSSGTRQAANRTAGSIPKRGEKWATAGIVWDSSFSSFGLSTFMNVFFRLAKRKLKQNSHIYTFIDWRHYPLLSLSQEGAGLFINNLIVWDKGSFTLGGNYRSQYELITFASKDNPKRLNTTTTGNVLKFKRVFGGQHPTEKPLDLTTDLIKFSSQENDLILDAFIGSGTTAIACKNLKRNFIGIEINPDYCKIAEERLAQGVL